jgi:hypothetical protein
LVTFYELTQLQLQVRKDLAEVISVPFEWITINGIRIGSLIVDFTIRRNGTYYIADSVINSLIMTASFNNTIQLYKTTTLITDENIQLTKVSLLLPSYTGSLGGGGGAASSCAAACIAGVIGGLAGGALIIGGTVWLIIRYRRNKREEARKQRHLEDGIGFVDDHNVSVRTTPRGAVIRGTPPPQNPIRFHDPFALSAAANLPENQASPFHIRSPEPPVYYFHTDDLVSSKKKNTVKNVDPYDIDDDDPDSNTAAAHAIDFYEMDDEEGNNAAFQRSIADAHFAELEKENIGGSTLHPNHPSGEDDNPDGLVDVFDVMSVGSSSPTTTGMRSPKMSSSRLSMKPTTIVIPPTRKPMTPPTDRTRYEFRNIRSAADVSSSSVMVGPTMATPASFVLGDGETSSVFEDDVGTEDDFDYEYEWVEAPRPRTPQSARAASPVNPPVEPFVAIYRDDDVPPLPPQVPPTINQSVPFRLPSSRLPPPPRR